MKNSHRLQQILETARKAKKNNQKVLAVFDIDSTLFDVSPRLEKILLEFADDPHMQKKFPEQIPLLKQIKTLGTDWGITNALERVGLDGHHQDFQDSVHQWWHERFFSNEYVKYDKPYEGAVDFVKALYKAGAEVVYLTGRDIDRMGIGSPQVMKDNNFPLDEISAHLVLKPHKSMNDARFKTDWFLQEKNLNYDHIYFFENEPVNVHLVIKECPKVEVIFFNSAHSGKAQPPTDIPHIMDYLCHIHEE